MEYMGGVVEWLRDGYKIMEIMEMLEGRMLLFEVFMMDAPMPYGIGMQDMGAIFMMDTIFTMDAPIPYGIGMQDMGSINGAGMDSLHDMILYYLVIVLIVVTWMMLIVIVRFRGRALVDCTSTHGTLIELIWTILPTIILVLIAIPSFNLLYLMDSITDPVLTLKVIGRQWYWSYEYPITDSDNDSITNYSYDSYMVADSDLLAGQLRLVTVDLPVVLPVDAHTRIITTASDVIHSWAIPSLGMKADAIPGRINQLSLFINRSGIYYGQCSELCGVNHAYMPITLYAVELANYLQWLSSISA